MNLLSSRYQAILWILFLASFLFFFRLGERPLRNPDEGRYAQIAATMVESGRWMEPCLFDIDYLRKPPLFYWLLASSFSLFGQNEWAARLVPALFGLLGVLATYFFTQKHFGRQAALVASLFLATNPWYVHVSRFLVIDAVFSFFVICSLYFFYEAMSGGGKSQLKYIGFYGCVALAFLSKGILALVFPGIAIALYAVWTRQLWKIIRESYLLPGLFLFLLIVGPWLWWMSVHKETFWDIFFFREHFSRFAAKDFEHQEGWYFYPVILVAILSPWLLFPGPWRVSGEKIRSRAYKNPIFFLLIFGLANVLFLSLSRSKLATYIVPFIPAFCILLGVFWSAWMEENQRRWKIFYVVLPVMALGVIGAVFVMEIVNSPYTTRPLALAAKTQVKSGDLVYVFDHPGPFYDFPFYLKHPVKPIGFGGELEVSSADASAKSKVVSRADFMEQLKQGFHFFCLIRRSDWNDFSPELRSSLKVIAQDERKVFFESGARS